MARIGESKEDLCSALNDLIILAYSRVLIYEFLPNAGAKR